MNLTSPREIVSVTRLASVVSKSITFFNMGDDIFLGESSDEKLGWPIKTSMSPLSALPRLKMKYNPKNSYVGSKITIII